MSVQRLHWSLNLGKVSGIVGRKSSMSLDFSECKRSQRGYADRVSQCARETRLPRDWATRKKFILEELPNSSETEDMRKIR